MKHPLLRHRLRFTLRALFICIVIVQTPLLSLAESVRDSISLPDLEKAIEQFIRTHPEVIVESLQAIGVKRKEAERQRVKRALTFRQNDLVNDPASPVSGNPNGQITVIEFHDYRCRVCKRVASAVTQLQNEDSRVRVVYKDFPILGDVSELVAKAALAANAQGKHQAFHEALLASNDDLTRDMVLKIAEQVGLDTQRLQTDMANPEWQSIFERNRSLAKDLGIRGTPAFIVGTEVVSGGLDLKELKELIVRATDAK